jgi:hypothetical protein
MRGTQSKDAFESFKVGVRARALPLTETRWQQSDQAFRRAIEIDTGLTFDQALEQRKGYPRAWSWMAYGRVLSYFENYPNAGTIAEGIQYADLSVELDPYDYDNHWVAAFVHLANGSAQQAEMHMNEALYLNEEDLNMNLLNEMADILTYLGRTDDAIKLLERARRTTDWNHYSMAWCLFFKGMDDPIFYDRALEETRKTYWQPGEEEYEHDIQLLVAAIHIQKAANFRSLNQPEYEQEQNDKAQKALALFQNRRSAWTRADELKRLPFAGGGQRNRDHWDDALTKLGWPK